MPQELVTLSMSFNLFDFLLLMIVLLSILMAFHKGFIKSTLSLAGWIIAIVFTYRFYPYLEPMLLKYVSGITSLILGYVGVLVACLIFFAIFNYVVAAIFREAVGSAPDKLLGCMLGAMRGCLLIVVFFACYTAISGILNETYVKNDDIERFPEPIRDSVSLPLLLQGEHLFLEFVPESFKQALTNTNHKKTAQDDVTLIKQLKQNIRILSKFTDTESLKTLKTHSAQNAIAGESELVTSIYIMDKLLANYAQSYNAQKIQKNQALSVEELYEMQNLLQKAQEKNASKNQDFIEEAINKSEKDE
jgi:membrane protein required for colicin V production